jgi:hypothetical protein
MMEDARTIDRKNLFKLAAVVGVAGTLPLVNGCAVEDQTAPNEVGSVASVAALKNIDTTSSAAYPTGKSVYVRGFDVQGDGGGGEFWLDRASTEAEDSGTVFAPNTGPGRWKRNVDGRIVSASWFGAGKDNASQDMPRLQELAAYVNARDGATVVFPSGKLYRLNGTVDFHSSYSTYVAHGAFFRQDGTGPCFDLNSRFLGDVGNTGDATNIRWFGGKFDSAFTGNATYNDPANSAIGLRFRGVWEGLIANAQFMDLAVGIEWAPIDGCMITECFMDRNKTHVQIPNFQHKPGDPQGNGIFQVYMGDHTLAGIHLQKGPNALTIRKASCVGDNSMVIESGADINHGNINGRSLYIEDCTFEQPNGGFYIRVVDNNNKALDMMTVRNCTFDFRGGKPVSVAHVNGFLFEANYVESDQRGWLTLSSTCRSIVVRSPNVFSFLSDPKGAVVNNAPAGELRFV